MDDPLSWRHETEIRRENGILDIIKLYWDNNTVFVMYRYLCVCTVYILFFQTLRWYFISNNNSISIIKRYYYIYWKLLIY